MNRNADRPGTGAQSGQPAATRAALSAVLVELLDQARREVSVFAPVLEADCFNTARFADSLGQFVARHHANRACFLVEDGQQVVRDNARLAALARRFADAVQFRRVGEDHRGLRELFMVIDSLALVHILDIDRIDAPAPHFRVREATALARRFRGMWDMGEPLAEISVTGL